MRDGQAEGLPQQLLQMKSQFQFDRVYVASGVQFRQYQGLSLEVLNKAGSGGSLGEADTRLLAARFQNSLEDAVRRTGVFQEVRADASGSSPAHL